MRQDQRTPVSSPEPGRRLRSALLALLLPAVAAAETAGNTPLLADFAGEYDNYEQVWQHGLDEASDAMIHVHINVAPVALAGAPAYLLQAWQDDDRDRLVAQQLYLPEAPAQPATVTRYELGPAPIDPGRSKDGMRLPAAIAADLADRPHCVLQLTRRDDHVRARPAAPCPGAALAEALQKDDGFELRPELLTLPLPGADRQIEARRVRYFTGWMGVKRQRWDPEAGDDDWVFMKDFRLHNEGQIVRLVEKDGTPTGYAIQLERLTYQNTRTAVLKLGLTDEAQDKTITYTWTSPGASRIGMNLRWFQAGLTRVADK